MAEGEFIECDLPFVKVFRGPHWGINQNTYSVLESLGYSHVYTHEDYRKLALQNNKNMYSQIYNWNLKDEAPNLPLLIGHGHTHNVCGNGIQETFDRVCSFIEQNNPQFKFVSEI